jgi:hypothetical protein
MGKCKVCVTLMECKMETDRQTDRCLCLCLCLVGREDGALKVCMELVLVLCDSLCGVLATVSGQ